MGYALKLNAQCGNTCGNVTGSNSSAFNTGTSSGSFSMTIGKFSRVESSNSHLLGLSSIIEGSSDFSSIFGNYSLIGENSEYSFLFGNSNTIGEFADNAMALGYSNNILTGGAYSILLGHENRTDAQFTLALGKNNILHGEYSAALGLGLQTGSAAHHSIALGFGTSTFEPYSLAFAAGSATPAIYVKGSQFTSEIGYVGIGNKEPKARLDISGDVRLSGHRKSLFFASDPTLSTAEWGMDYDANHGFRIFEPIFDFSGGGGGVGDDCSTQIVEWRTRLFIQDISGNVGIGNTRPLHKLQVDGSLMINTNEASLIFDDSADPENCNGRWGIKYESSGLNFWKPIRSLEAAPGEEELNYALFISDSDGKIGIGTELPETQLHVNGDVRITDLGNPSLTTLDRITLADADGDLKTSESLLINNNGSIGIGLDPNNDYTNFSNTWNNYKLYVNGGIVSTEMWVKITDNWSDFVFGDNYRLRPLSEVEEFINDNGHLPEIPSAEQVAEEGINMGQMDAKLLQKIEELTLYMIEQEKRIESQNAKIESLSQELKELKK